MSEPESLRVYLFDTTSLAMWAEEVALERGIPAEVAPAPPGVRGKCGLSLRTFPRHAGELEAALREEGVAFHRLEEVVEPGA